VIIDNFALELYQSCPALYLLRIKRRLVPIRRKAALGFGGAMHAGMAEWYRTHDKVMAVKRIVEVWPQGMPADDFRTREKCVQTILDYCIEYPDESFKIIGWPDAPLIEKAFTIDTGMKCEDGEPILYGGIIDLGIDFNTLAYPVEHKSTTRLGDQWALQFKPNNQVTGYIWALKQLSTMKCNGAMVNGVGIYKASPTKFKRHLTSRSDTEIQFWLNNVRKVCNDIRRAEATGEWEWRTRNCTMFGQCDYHNVHVLGTEVEQEKRISTDYVISEWNHEERDD